MTKCASSPAESSKSLLAGRPRHAVVALLFAFPRLLSLDGQVFPTPGPTAQVAQNFPLTNLIVTGGKAEVVEYQGRKAVRLTAESKGDCFAFLKGSQFQDGTIEADIALKVITPAGIRRSGFIGIAFRARSDASRYELFYLRTGNFQSEDWGMCNHSIQYLAEPGFAWYAAPAMTWICESYMDLPLQRWIRLKIEVHERTAKLYVNGSENPGFVVSHLKGEDPLGGIALWGYSGEEAYFSNVKVIPATPEAISNR